MPKTRAKSLQGVCIDRRGKYYLLVNGQADPVLKDKVTIPPHVFSKYDLGEGMLADLVRECMLASLASFSAVDTNAQPVKFQDGPIIK
eukprot:g56789.t1